LAAEPEVEPARVTRVELTATPVTAKPARPASDEIKELLKEAGSPFDVSEYISADDYESGSE
jgi:hypothetical protein